MTPKSKIIAKAIKTIWPGPNANNIKLKFISNLGKFDNLDNFETPFEYQSKINKDNLKINPDQAFESGGYREDNEDIPF